MIAARCRSSPSRLGASRRISRPVNQRAGQHAHESQRHHRFLGWLVHADPSAVSQAAEKRLGKGGGVWLACVDSIDVSAASRERAWGYLVAFVQQHRLRANPACHTW